MQEVARTGATIKRERRGEESEPVAYYGFRHPRNPFLSCHLKVIVQANVEENSRLEKAAFEVTKNFTKFQTMQMHGMLYIGSG